MTALTHPDKTYEFDTEGFLLDHTTWTPELAQTLADQEGIGPLTPAHWTVIEFCRGDYEATSEVPTLRRIKTVGGIPTKDLYALFPQGPAKKVARIAGLKKPTGCL